MEILEHTSTHLILRDTAEGVWIAKLLSGIFLIWGCWDLFLVITEQYSKGFLITIHIIFFIGLGTAMALYPWKNTVYFDKNSGKLKIEGERVVGTKAIEYPLVEISEVIIDQAYSSDGNMYVVALRVASNYQNLYISKVAAFTTLNKAEELANLIRTFLNMPR